MPWVDTTDELPPIGAHVPVYGDYVVPAYGYPISYRRADRFERDGWMWFGAEWRGTVAIRAWWREPESDNQPIPVPPNPA